MHVHPVLVKWIIAFLYNRTQAVRIENVISERENSQGRFTTRYQVRSHFVYNHDK